MRSRTVIDLSQTWAMRVSTPGNDVELDGPPFGFDGSLETMQVHQTGVIPNVFQSQYAGTNAERCIRPAGGAMLFPEIVVSFPALPFVPHIEWAITSAYLGNAVDFPNNAVNVTATGTGDTIYWLRCAVIATTSSFKLIGTDGGAYTFYDRVTPAEARQGNFYYTVFRRPTT